MSIEAFDLSIVVIAHRKISDVFFKRTENSMSFIERHRIHCPRSTIRKTYIFLSIDVPFLFHLYHSKIFKLYSSKYTMLFLRFLCFLSKYLHLQKLVQRSHEITDVLRGDHCKIWIRSGITRREY